MPGSTVPASFRQQFHDSFYLLSQQKMSRLRNLFSPNLKENVQGESVSFDRMGKTTAHKITNRYGDTPLNEVPFSRRRVFMEDYNNAILKAPQDVRKMTADPSSRIVQAQVAAMGRQLDDIIVSALLGNATAIDENGSSSNVALPSAQKVAAASAGLTQAKIQDALQKLDESDVDEDVARFLIIGPAQKNDLLGISTLTSGDYQQINSVQTGKMAMALGFNIIMSNRLTTDSNSDRQVIACTENALGIGIGQEIITDIGPRRDKNMAIQFYNEMSWAAVRIEEEQVVEIACVES